MNRIFKTVWNRVRCCYVAVNEKVTNASQASSKSLASLVLTSLCVSQVGAASFVWQDGYLTKDALDGYDEIYITQRATGFTVGQINSPNAKLWVGDHAWKPGVPQVGDQTPDTAFYSNAVVNGDVNVRMCLLSLGKGEFHGNVYAIGASSNNAVDKYLAVLNGTLDQAVRDQAWAEISNVEGTMSIASAYEMGGTTIDGNVKASFLKIGYGLHYPSERETIGGYVHVKGNVDAENVHMDNPDNYDDISDTFIVDGTLNVNFSKNGTSIV